MLPRVGLSCSLIVVTESPHFRDGITNALFIKMPHTYSQTSSQWANCYTQNAHKRTPEVLMFPSIPCMVTYFAHEAQSDIIMNCVNFRLKMMQHLKKKNAPFLMSCHPASNYSKYA